MYILLYILFPEGMTGGYSIELWSEKEDTKLVDALMELHVSRKYVYANIDWEYVHAVQRLMDPNLFYTAKTVKNRMRNMEINFNTVHELLAGRQMSGFSYDREKLCVIADKQIWDKYVKTHTNAAQFRKRPFPHYEKLCIIYGFKSFLGDGLGGEGVVGENHMKSCLEANDLHVGGDVPSSYGVREDASIKRKRDDGYDLSETCGESLVKVANNARKFGRTLNEGIDATIDTMDKVMTQMEDLHGLTLDERLLAMSVIGRNATLFRMFDRLDEDGKIRMAQMVANGSIS